MKLRIMSRNDIKRAVNMDAMMKTVESVYRYKAEGKTIVWPTVFHDFETGRQDMDIKSGYIMGEEIHGLKVINWTQALLPGCARAVQAPLVQNILPEKIPAPC